MRVDVFLPHIRVNDTRVDMCHPYEDADIFSDGIANIYAVLQSFFQMAFIKSYALTTISDPSRIFSSSGTPSYG